MPAAALRQVNRSGIGHATVAGPSSLLREPAMSKPIPAIHGTWLSRRAGRRTRRGERADLRLSLQVGMPVRVAA
jgi:hypothetical protein